MSVAKGNRRNIPMPRLNKQEHNAVLGALRMLQRCLPGWEGHGIHEILTDGGVPKMSPDEIDALCERIN